MPGGLACVGASCTQGDSRVTRAEPEGPDHHPRRRVKVLDTEISYVDTGEGEPVVFLHGNPTSSYLWRNIIPYVSPHRRCLAPDMVGMGRSGKSPTKAYRFVDHARYLDAWFDRLRLTKNVTFVVHDWGSVIGFYRARRYAEQVKALAYMESIVLPRRWEDFPGGRDKLFRALRSPEGERLILDENAFVELVLPRGMMRTLSPEEMEAYRAPYREREARLPTLVWPRELPIEGEPADTIALVEQNAQWLAGARVPKLFIQRRTGKSPDRALSRVLPDLAEPARGHRQGFTLPAGGLPQGDRRGPEGVRARPSRLMAQLSVQFLPGEPWLKGVIWGLMPWFVVQVRVMPMMGGGLFSAQASGLMAVMASLLGHTIYGAMLGPVAGGSVGRPASPHPHAAA